METQIQGENVAPVEPKKEYDSDVKSITAQLEAEIKAKREASMRPTVPVVPATNTTTVAPTQLNGNPPVAKAPEANKPDTLQQFRDKDGQVDPTKVEKANEHLQKSIDDKESRLQGLLKTNKELMRKHSQVSQEVKSEEKSLDEKVPEFTGKLTPELKARYAEMLEKDPVEAVFLMGRLGARAEVEPDRRDWAGFRAENRDTSLAKELDELGQNGHSWVYSPEGHQLFDAAFQERPFLLQSKTPYKDAMRFIDASQAQQPTAAPVVRSTPILGAGHAVPPPSSMPTEAPEQQLRVLNAQFTEALQIRDMKTASEVGLKIKQVESRRFLNR